MEVRDDALAAEVERILQSATFRNSEALRRLLRFLADKRLSGEADQLKEYSVGIDVLGKPASYDPRQDSIVRIQAGRLRQKLAEYYRTEGKNDHLVIDLPKGCFKLAYEELPTAAPPTRTDSGNGHAHVVPVPADAPPVSQISRRIPRLLGAGLLVAVAWAAVATAGYWRERQRAAGFSTMWTPELEQLWQPFLSSSRPLLVSIADPPFVQFKGFGAYRDLTLNTWDEIIKAPAVAAIRKALGNVDVQPNVYYAPMGEVNASFLLGKLLGPRVQALSLLRTSELSFQQIADNNLLFIGAPVFFEKELESLPVKLEFVNARPGIHILHPLAGEPDTLSDELPSGSAENGEAYVLVTHVSGPLGHTEVESFTSNRTAGRLTAVQWFTEPTHARTLLEKLRTPSGQIPQYYQVVLKVKYTAGVPAETSYVMHREVHVTGNP